MNDLGKYSVTLFDISQPYRFTLSNGLKCDPFPLSVYSCLSRHFGCYGHIVMFAQGGLNDDHMGSLNHVHCHDLTLDPVGSRIGCPAVRWNGDQYYRYNDREQDP
jgi:hypothetical protein